MQRMISEEKLRASGDCLERKILTVLLEARRFAAEVGVNLALLCADSACKRASSAMMIGSLRNFPPNDAASASCAALAWISFGLADEGPW